MYLSFRDFVKDENNHRIQKCPMASVGSDCQTVAGTGSSGSGATQLSYPQGVAVDSNGDYVIADAWPARLFPSCFMQLTMGTFAAFGEQCLTITFSVEKCIEHIRLRMKQSLIR